MRNRFLSLLYIVYIVNLSDKLSTGCLSEATTRQKLNLLTAKFRPSEVKCWTQILEHSWFRMETVVQGSSKLASFWKHYLSFSMKVSGQLSDFNSICKKVNFRCEDLIVDGQTCVELSLQKRLSQTSYNVTSCLAKRHCSNIHIMG